jgi:hypothetical protein
MGDWKPKIEASLREHHSIYYTDLVHPRPVSLDDQDAVLVDYLDFFEWLGGIPSFDWWGHDPTLSNGLAVDIGKYFRDKKDYFNDVKNQWRLIQKFDTGKALLNELQLTGFSARIKPFLEFSALGWNATADPKSEHHARPQGCSGGDGQGTNSNITYTAEMWPPYNSTRYSPSMRAAATKGPGNLADEILFHELVHATRQMRGVMCRKHVDRLYDTEEEYIALVISNIYLSEKKKNDLVADHSARALSEADAERFLDNPQGIDVAPRALIEQFKSQQRQFYDRLAGIAYDQRTGKGPKFNPIRQYAEEEKAIRKHFEDLRRAAAPK